MGISAESSEYPFCCQSSDVFIMQYTILVENYTQNKNIKL